MPTKHIIPWLIFETTSLSTDTEADFTLWITSLIEWIEYNGLTMKSDD